MEDVWHINVLLNFSILGSDDGFLPVQRQAIIWKKNGLLLIGPLGTKFSKIFIKIKIFSFNEMHFNIDGLVQKKTNSSALAMEFLALTHRYVVCKMLTILFWSRVNRDQENITEQGKSEGFDSCD